MRWRLVAFVVAFAIYCYYVEIRKYTGYAALYVENCFPEKYPGTCPGLSSLAKLQYSRAEAALLGMLGWFTDAHRWWDYSPYIAAVAGLGSWFRRRKRVAVADDDDWADWWFTLES